MKKNLNFFKRKGYVKLFRKVAAQSVILTLIFSPGVPIAHAEEPSALATPPEQNPGVAPGAQPSTGMVPSAPVVSALPSTTNTMMGGGLGPASDTASNTANSTNNSNTSTIGTLAAAQAAYADATDALQTIKDALEAVQESADIVRSRADSMRELYRSAKNYINDPDHGAAAIAGRFNDAVATLDQAIGTIYMAAQAGENDLLTQAKLDATAAWAAVEQAAAEWEELEREANGYKQQAEGATLGINEAEATAEAWVSRYNEAMAELMNLNNQAQAILNDPYFSYPQDVTDYYSGIQDIYTEAQGITNPKTILGNPGDMFADQDLDSPPVFVPGQITLGPSFTLVFNTIYGDDRRAVHWAGKVLMLVRGLEIYDIESKKSAARQRYEDAMDVEIQIQTPGGPISPVPGTAQIPINWTGVMMGFVNGAATAAANFMQQPLPAAPRVIDEVENTLQLRAGQPIAPALPVAPPPREKKPLTPAEVKQQLSDKVDIGVQIEVVYADANGNTVTFTGTVQDNLNMYSDNNFQMATDNINNANAFMIAINENNGSLYIPSTLQIYSINVIEPEAANPPPAPGPAPVPAPKPQPITQPLTKDEMKTDIGNLVVGQQVTIIHFDPVMDAVVNSTGKIEKIEMLTADGKPTNNINEAAKVTIKFAKSENGGQLPDLTIDMNGFNIFRVDYPGKKPPALPAKVEPKVEIPPTTDKDRLMKLLFFTIDKDSNADITYIPTGKTEPEHITGIVESVTYQNTSAIVVINVVKYEIYVDSDGKTFRIQDYGKLVSVEDKPRPPAPAPKPEPEKKEMEQKDGPESGSSDSISTLAYSVTVANSVTQVAEEQPKMTYAEWEKSLPEGAKLVLADDGALVQSTIIVNGRYYTYHSSSYNPVLGVLVVAYIPGSPVGPDTIPTL